MNLTILKEVCEAERNGRRKFGPGRKLFWIGRVYCERVGWLEYGRRVVEGVGGWSA
jgi:hypothetical protein